MRQCRVEGLALERQRVGERAGMMRFPEQRQMAQVNDADTRGVLAVGEDLAVAVDDPHHQIPASRGDAQGIHDVGERYLADDHGVPGRGADADGDLARHRREVLVAPDGSRILERALEDRVARQVVADEFAPPRMTEPGLQAGVDHPAVAVDLVDGGERAAPAECALQGLLRRRPRIAQGGGDQFELRLDRSEYGFAAQRQIGDFDAQILLALTADLRQTDEEERGAGEQKADQRNQ